MEASLLRIHMVNISSDNRESIVNLFVYLYFILLFIEIPGKPGVPKITDWDVDKVDLAWTEPKHDGGAPIVGYVIEKKEKLSTVWDEILTTKVCRE